MKVTIPTILRAVESRNILQKTLAPWNSPCLAYILHFPRHIVEPYGKVEQVEDVPQGDKRDYGIGDTVHIFVATLSWADWGDYIGSILRSGQFRQKLRRPCMEQCTTQALKIPCGYKAWRETPSTPVWTIRQLRARLPTSRNCCGIWFPAFYIPSIVT